MVQKSFTIHLAKADITQFHDALTATSRERLGDENTIVVNEPTFAEGACLYVFVGRRSPPKWLGDLQRRFELDRRIETSSACAILMFRTAGRLFATSFAHGWMYLEQENFESDFGLKAALNALDDKKLRRLERANLANALQGVALSPFQRQFSSFGLDDALDLVRKVGGATKNEASADTMTGARSLRIVGEFSFDDLPELAAEALEQFQSLAYQDTAFNIIDVVMPISDGSVARELDELAAQSIRDGLENFELGLPSNFDDDDVAFKFEGPRLRRRFPDLLLRNYVAALGDHLAELTPQTLRDHKIVQVFEDGSTPDQRWTIRKGLIGSLAHEGSQYAINEGVWYRVDEIFRTSVEDSYTRLVQPWDIPPVPLLKHYDASGNGAYETEASYNAGRAAALGYVLLDTQSVSVPGVLRSGFEPCDLLDVAGRRFIHVKKNSRRSNILSHLFKQGSNAAQNFKRYPAAWDDLTQLVTRIAGANEGQRVADARSDQWVVEFWIADAPRVGGGHNIPFFSKISLRDEVNNLRAMGYSVNLRFIGLEPERIQ